MHYANGAVELRFGAAGILYGIGVFSGYRGRYRDVSVGNRLDAVLRHTPLTFDSGDEMHYPPIGSDIRGIAFLAGAAPLDED